jgi:molybdopterin-guanine dinucleotide biosynthesis protein A
MPRHVLVGAILVGGASRRMGQPKHALRLADGRTLLEHVAAALAPVCDELVLLGGAVQPPPAGPWRRVADLRPGEGPLAGIEALLAAGLAERHLVCPCDVPRVTSALLAALAAPSARPATVLQVEGEAAPRPLPACFTSAALAAVSAALDAGARSVRGVIAALDAEVVAAPVEWAALLQNVNEPGDVARLGGGMGRS